ncbi:similar to Zygosaccharomyces rouxii ZYRO0E00462g hypothetical protein [Maudiozyma saulgeensis]|uniref:Transcriptional regulator n=1 Tax=Maudiozyma saulgeensis TaxID=1789683 RepID=A0A1X7R9Z5_9SACH|nr:similar to Zygosaccharomyces rouxii ZYRO0E00462g hypothetical protein [Kazachstania saulgeensis]
MYIPKSMEVTSTSKLVQLIKEYPLGSLFNYNPPTSALLSYFSGGNPPSDDSIDNEMCCSHIPFFIEECDNGSYTLIAHMAKNNQHVEMLKKNPRCLIVFQGPDSYITPSWYPLKSKTHKFVPTWDYATVHVYGEATIISDKSWLVDMITKLTNQQEERRSEGETIAEKWKVSDAPTKYIDKRLDEVVGIKININHFQGKFKLQQDMSKENVKGVLEGYENEMNGEKYEQLAKLTKEQYPEQP